MLDAVSINAFARQVMYGRVPVIYYMQGMGNSRALAGHLHEKHIVFVVFHEQNGFH
jgi:hypothetical protein